MKLVALFPLFTLLLASPLGAQNQNEKNPPTEEDTNTASSTRSRDRFWQASIPGGDFMVAIDRISSISMQTYMIGGLVVYEVNVDTIGQALARFYYIETPKTSSTALNQAAERAEQVVEHASGRIGIDPLTMVVKTPNTTHAKCIEYRLQSLEELDALYKSVQTTWETGKGRKFTVRKAS